MVVCDCVYRRFPDAREGDLAKAKAFLVSEPTLAEAALAFGLDTALELSGPEEAAGGRTRRSILSDAFEAVVAAIYLDQGFRAACRFVRRALKDALKRVGREDYHRDYKSLLQERMQSERRLTPHYHIAAETGADHDKTFVARAMIGGEVIGEGQGKSKKQAEQAAAMNALERITDAEC
jgi:ribonuclease-3